MSHAFREDKQVRLQTFLALPICSLEPRSSSAKIATSMHSSNVASDVPQIEFELAKTLETLPALDAGLTTVHLLYQGIRPCASSALACSAIKEQRHNMLPVDY